MNVVAKQLSRKFWWRVLQIVLVETPRLRRRLRRAERRGEPTEPILAEADKMGEELKRQFQLLSTVRRAERMLKKAGWQ